MTPIVKEWVQKAEGDYSSALLLLRSRKSPNYDAARFHSQQCAEKYLKALLQKRNIAFPKTHDLAELVKLLSTSDPQWLLLTPQLEELSKAAVEVRYIGTSSTKQEASEAVAVAKQVRDLARHSLSLRTQADAPRRKRGKKRG
jgi:HEPN domain-containing protein